MGRTGPGNRHRIPNLSPNASHPATKLLAEHVMGSKTRHRSPATKLSLPTTLRTQKDHIIPNLPQRRGCRPFATEFVASWRGKGRVGWKVRQVHRHTEKRSKSARDCHLHLQHLLFCGSGFRTTWTSSLRTLSRSFKSLRSAGARRSRPFCARFARLQPIATDSAAYRVRVVAAMAILGDTVPMVREVATSAVLANAHYGVHSSPSPSFAKVGTSFTGRTAWLRDSNVLRRRVLVVNRSEMRNLVSSRVFWRFYGFEPIS